MNASRQISRLIPFLAAGACVMGLAATASANGIAVARFGGAHGNVTESNPASIYYNPGAIGFSEGTQMMFDLALVQRNASYERPVGAISDDSTRDGDNVYNTAVGEANAGTANLNNQLFAPMLGFTTDFGSSLGLRAGLALFVPFGGSSVWDRTDQVDGFPESDLGVNRWFNVEGSIRTSAVALDLAYRLGPVSVGVVGNLYLSQVDTVRSRNGNGSDNPATEGMSYINASSTDFGLGFGALWRVTNGLDLGLSYQSRPNFTGDILFEGTLTNAFPNSGAGDPSDVYMTHQLPDIFRLGVSYRPDGSPFEVRLAADLTRWSVFEAQCIIGTDGLDADQARSACETNADGSQVDASTPAIANFVREWNDAVGVRFGGSYFLMSPVELFLGGGYDMNAIPDETLEPAFIDQNKFSVDLGTRLALGDLAVTFTGTRLFYSERDTTDTNTLGDLQVPSRLPSAAGVYNQSIWMLDTTIEYAF